MIAATGIKPATLERLRAACCKAGPVAALERKKQDRPSRPPVVTGEVEARLTALACSEAPGGRKRWTLRLLADKLVELEIVGEISHETVRQALKKRNQALAEALLVHSAQAERGVRRRHGRRAGDLRAAARPGPAAGLPGRFLQAASGPGPGRR